MVATNHRTYTYVGLAGEGDFIGEGGLLRQADGEDAWKDISAGLPGNPQVRALLLRADDPAVVFAGTQGGVYRSTDRGASWQRLSDPAGGREVWSLAAHPSDPDTIFAGYEPCAIARSQDGGNSWQDMDTSKVIYPHITTYMPPLGKRVIGISVDPVDSSNVYAAIEVGGLLASRDGGETWEQLMDGPYLRNNTLDLHQVQVSAADHDTVQIATQIAMFRGRQKGNRWEHVQVDDMFPGGSYCRDLAVAPDDPNTIYLASGAGGGAAPPDTVPEGALFRSRDVGETWERIDLGDVPPGRMMQIAIDAGAPSRISCAAYSGEVYSSSDNGQSWSKSMLPVEPTRSLHIYPLVCG
jgi:photosystem II stability/assembly factor-like uncharacterized protein